MSMLFRVVDEASWFSCAIPRHLLRFLKDRTSARKMRLWAWASAIQLWPANVHLCETFQRAEWLAEGQYPANLEPMDEYCLSAVWAWRIAYEGTVRRLEKWPTSEKKRQATEFQLATLHDIFGNPFRPVSLDPAWLTSDVVTLARGIYDERAFDRVPILADALQDAGCDNDDILDHCRDTAVTHVRGCWVVDLMLGKL